MRRRGVLCVVLLLTACASPGERMEEALERARQAATHGRPDRALEILGDALSYDPRHLPVRVGLAELLLQLGRAHEATSVLGELPADVEPDAAYRVVLFQASLAAQDLDTALPLALALWRQDALEDQEIVRLCEAVGEGPGYELPPGLPAAWRATVVRHQIRRGDLAAAARSLSVDPIGPRDLADPTALVDELLRAILDQDAVELLQRQTHLLEPPPTPWKLAAQHRLLEKQRRRGLAQELEARFLEEHRTHPARFHILAAGVRRRVRLNRPEEGLALADEALALKPHKAEMHALRGLSLEQLGRFEEASTAFDRALELDPENAMGRGFFRRHPRQNPQDPLAAVTVRVETP